MFNFKIFNKVSTEVLTIKNDLELNSEIQLINKYKTAHKKADLFPSQLFDIVEHHHYNTSV